MRTSLISLLAFVALVACASNTAFLPPPPRPPGDPDVVQGQMPPHKFQAREHHGHPQPVPVAASISSLPKLALSSRCVNAGAIKEGRPSVNRRRRASGFVKYDAKRPAGGSAQAAGGSAQPKRAKTKAPPAKHAPVPPSASEAGPPAAEPEPLADAAPSDDSGDGDAAVGQSAAVEDSANSAPIAKRGRNSRADRKARRGRRKRGRAKPLSMSAPAEAPGGDVAPQVVELEPEYPPPGEGWGEATFLSNDDTMSLSSAQRVMFAIDNFAPIAPEQIRRHELLNYFSFDAAPVDEGHDFSVLAEIEPSFHDANRLSLGLAVRGRTIGRSGRRNAVLTLVVDRSGSMRREGRMEFLKRGLLRMVRELKDGDVVHMVTFDQRVCTPLKNFVVGRDNPSTLTRVIHAIRPSGSTNMHAGLTKGYQIADASYQPAYTNRVVVITDAIANVGQTNPRTMAMVSDFFDSRRIRLSGIGVGREFNDALLDRLTERGRGAYVFLGSEAEVDAVFGNRFVSLIETAANDVHFRLHLPPSLRLAAFHGEQASTVKADVQAVHFFADTSQFFLAELEAWQGSLRAQDDIMVEVEYLHTETGKKLVEEYVFNIGDIAGASRNIRKGELVLHFIDSLSTMARRPPPARRVARVGGWSDGAAASQCATTRQQLDQLAARQRDPEITRVLGLWDGFCSRFEGRRVPGRPGRKR